MGEGLWYGYAGEVGPEGTVPGSWMSVLVGPTLEPPLSVMRTGPGMELPFVRSWPREPDEEQKKAALGPPAGWDEEE